MSDLISRQDAIDAINHICPIDTEYDCALLDRVDVRCVLSDLPSAEPERIIKIGQRSGKTLESAINYLQSTGWLQEHDRILTESVKPESKWIPVSERLPENHKDVLVYGVEAISNEYVYGVKRLDVDTWRPKIAPSIRWIAWMPLPEPWRGE